MPLFESTLVLLAVAVVLLTFARRLRIPYPAMLALAGGLVATLPWAPRIGIEPHLALALFVAPAVMDTAFDMPPRELLRMWLPLTSLAVFLVLLTALAVAAAGVLMAGLPLAAAIALGAIVAPPDAAAAAAVLQEFKLPRRTLGVLQGESLLNDATALLLFGAAVAAATTGGAWSASLPRLVVAVPGGVLFGAAMGFAYVQLSPKWAGTLAAIIAQFVFTYGTWILADRLQLSAIVAVVGLATIIARYMPALTGARARVDSYAVWAIVVFVLNVLAFLLMGLQARLILQALDATALWRALGFAGTVLAVVIGIRFAWVMFYGVMLREFAPFIARHLPSLPVPSARVGVLVSWCGMRGLVTLATAFALPTGFPGRDLIVLSAFTVVLGSLVIQGLSIRPLIALLRIAPDDSLDREAATARVAMLDAALLALADQPGDTARAVRAEYDGLRAASVDGSVPAPEHDKFRRIAITAQRRVLVEWRRQGQLDDDAYHLLEAELDRAELQAEASVAG